MDTYINTYTHTGTQGWVTLIGMLITGHIIEVTQSSDEETEMIHMLDSVYKKIQNNLLHGCDESVTTHTQKHILLILNRFCLCRVDLP